MSLRRSARARVSAAESDIVTPGEKRKRKRSTMTPETSQSPAKQGSPIDEQMNDGNTTAATATAPSSSSPSNGRPARKIIVKSSRKSMPEGATTINPLADLKKEKAEKVVDDDDEMPDLQMSDEDRTKLLTVLKTYAPTLMTTKTAHRSRGDHNINLQQLLSHQSCSIRVVRNHILAMREPLTISSSLRGHLSSSYISPLKGEVEEDRKKLSATTMALALLDEIAARARSAADDIEMTQGEKAKKKEDDYALNMRLPSGDYFTNAIRLPVKEAIQVDTGYSKLVSVVTQPLSLDTRPPPTLKERLPRLKTPKAIITSEGIEDEVVRPVSHLYYNAWSSYAPTYDSFDGSINVQASNALWRSKGADRAVLNMMAEEPMSRREVLEEMLEDMENIDADAVLEMYDELKEPASLQSNAARLAHLNQLQENRCKRTFAKRMLTHSALPEEPSDEEQRVADEIMDTLSHLIAQQTGCHSQLLPSKRILRAASGSACIDSALINSEAEAGYWGSLNENYYGPSATRRVTGARMNPIRPPAAIRDNETIRMEPINEEKVSAAMAQMGTMQKGKGMLDRFASQRKYSLDDHPHDRKLAVSASQPVPASIPHSIPLPQQHLNYQSQSHQMSPQGVGVMRPGMTPSRSSMQYNMSPPSSTPPARPYHHPQMRPSPSINPYQQQQQKMSGMYRPPASGSHRAWSQSSSQQQQHNYYPARPYAPDHRFVSGSPL